MNCPKCGKSTELGQNYCRDCGAELASRPRGRMRFAGVGMLAVMFVGLLVAMTGKMFGTQWVTYLGVVLVISAMFVLAAFALLWETRPRRRTSKPIHIPSPQPILEKADTTNKLLPVGEVDYIPSVVENTTDLLETRAKR